MRRRGYLVSVADTLCEWLRRRHVVWLAAVVAVNAGLAGYIEEQPHMVCGVS
jgi:hypothetical protein